MSSKRSTSRLYSFLLILVLLFAWTFNILDVMPAHAAGGVRHVKPVASGTEDCSSWDDACILQYALSVSGPSDEIWVLAGTYTPGTLRTDTFQLKASVALYGGFIGTETARDERNPVVNITTLSGDVGTQGDHSDNSYHVVTGVTGATMDGFTITGGNANDASSPNNCGGGMYNPTSSPTLMNVTFSGNSASYCGGGIYNFTSLPTLRNVTFNNNSALYGGGMYNHTSHALSLTNVTFNNNSAQNGGGMYNFTSNILSFTNVTFNNNSATYHGGGMENDTSSPHLINVTFNNNSAQYGGGMYNFTSSPNLWNVTFSDNSAGSAGGGMYNVTSAPIIYNTIFWGNTATSDAQISNATAGSSIVNDSVVQGGCPNGGTCTNIFSTDPLLGPLGDYGGFTPTIPLMVGSSAIDALLTGTNGCGTTIATDQRGVVRPKGSGCDIGAFEQDDFIAPSVTSFTLKTPSTSPTNTDTLTFLATFSESVTGVDTADFAVNSSPTTTATVTAVSQVTTSTYDVTISGGDLASFNGDVNLNLGNTPTITDLSGNALPTASEPSIDQTYVIDIIAPTITITEPDTSAALSKTITASASEGTLKMSNTTDSTCDRTLTFAAYSSQTFSSETDNGIQVCYQAVDAAGNIAYNLSNAIAGIDTTGPDTQIDTQPANPSNSADASFTFSSADGPTTFECSLDSGDYAACTSPTDYIGLGEGSHTFAVRAKDTAGNVDASPASYTWVIDLTRPKVVSSVRVNPNPTNAANVNFTVTFSDPVTGVSVTDFFLTVTGVSGASVTGVSGSGDVYTVTANTGSGNGTIRLDVPTSATITNLVGNPLVGLPYTGGETYIINKLFTIFLPLILR